MTLTMPKVDPDWIRDLAHATILALVGLVCGLIAIEAIMLKTFNVALFKGLTALLQLF